MLDALLGGAFVVDCPGEGPTSRIFVLECWNGPTRTAINGKSWPHKERLYAKSVHWKIVKALDLSDPMHLHGSHFRLDGEGDGDGGGGIGERRTPAVELGHRFLVTMIPQRAGWCMYHTHWHDEAQLTGGVHGPMIVLGPGKSYHPETDRTFLMSLPPRDPFGELRLMDSSPQPTAMRLKAGTHYRLRSVNIAPTMDDMRIALRDDKGQCSRSHWQRRSGDP